MKSKVISLFLVIQLLGNYLTAQTSWVSIPIRQDLNQTRLQEINSGQDLSILNQELLNSLDLLSPSISLGRASGITLAQGQLLIDHLLIEDAEQKKIKDYDPQGNLGFCFGRAVKIHLELLRYGVNKNSIKKIFVIGPMSVPGMIWQFHVATIVKDFDSNQWWALDMNLKEPVKVSEWMKFYERFSTDKEFRLFRKPLLDRTKSLRFYITEPQKIAPISWEYNIKPGGLFDPFYNDYFKDMFQFFKKNPQVADKKFNFNQCKKLFE